jgi:glutathione synthase/RimK-type ligase-like ATP-grasp enzyme
LLRPGLSFRLERHGRVAAAETCRAVWWRRPETPEPPDGATAPLWEAVRDQWRAFLRGLASVPGPHWVSHPDAIARAELKSTQLAEARRVGFDVPETVWTNDREVVSEALGSAGVVKSVATAYWEEGADARFVFARRMRSADVPPARRVAQQPVAVQPEIESKLDVRLTIIGDRVFAAQLREPSSQLDWRLETGVEWVGHRLPTEVAEQARRLVAALGLRFAGIDLLRVQDRYVFVELNPNGEWGWLQKAGLPLAAAMSDELIGSR